MDQVVESSTVAQGIYVQSSETLKISYNYFCFWINKFKLSSAGYYPWTQIIVYNVLIAYCVFDVIQDIGTESFLYCINTTHNMN